MRPRHFLLTLFVAIGALLAPACGGDDEGDSAARSSEEREASEEGADEGTSDPGSESGDGDSGGDDIPDLGDVVESIPGFGNLEECVDIAATYSSLYLEALGGEDGAKDAQRKAEELKDKFPEELHDEIDVVAAAIGEVAEEGLLSGTSALGTPEYEAADRAITDFLTEECGG